MCDLNWLGLKILIEKETSILYKNSVQLYLTIFSISERNDKSLDHCMPKNVDMFMKEESIF